MITAYSSVVKLPPGRYQVSTVLKSQVNPFTGVRGKRKPITSEKRPYKRTRPERKTRREREVERYLLDAAIDDPDELQEFWIRPAEGMQC
jgi:hypothetical protein